MKFTQHPPNKGEGRIYEVSMPSCVIEAHCVHKNRRACTYPATYSVGRYRWKAYQVHSLL